jgi:DNA polymerase-1
MVQLNVHKRYLIDASTLIFRYSFALGEIMSPEGELISGFSGFCKYIMKLIKEKEPSELLIAFDKCKNNFRKEISPIYKANRKSQPLIYPQVDHAIAFCQFVGIPIDYHLSYEADDLIASYSLSSDLNTTSIIVTCDKDLMQLVNDNTFVLNPFKNILYDRNGVFEHLGVYPEQIPLYLSICGDSSDNIPGVSGIGPVGARKLVSKHKLDELEGLLPQHYETILHGLSLVTLKNEAPIKNSSIKMTFDKDFFYKCSLFLQNYGIKQS